jgi:RNA 3'-terminal phosphate cyclase
VAERGVRAEQLGQRVAEGLANDLRAGATLDEHAADQMLAFLALARGESHFRVRALTSHARNTMWLIERLTSARFETTGAGRGIDVRVLT